MATLTGTQLAEVRQRVAQNGVPVNFTKAQINAAVQALEDWFEDTGRAAIGGAIEAAAPGVFTNAQKKKIAKWFLVQKAGLE